MSEVLLVPSKTFEISVEELRWLVAKYSTPIITNDTEAEDAKKKQRELVKIRTSITTAGKAWRDASNAYNKAVLSLEKVLLSEVTPTEELFKKSIEVYEHQLFLEAQKPKLKDRLDSCERYHIPVDKPEDLLVMSDDQFHQFVIEGQAARLRSLEEDQPTQQPKRVELRAYRDWLEANAYDPSTHFLSENATSCTLWKKVSTFNFPNA